MILNENWMDCWQVCWSVVGNLWQVCWMISSKTPKSNDLKPRIMSLKDFFRCKRKL